MRRIEFVQPAGPDERFAADAFDGQVGKVIPFNIEGSPGGHVNARVAAAKVSSDGRSVRLTLEVMDRLNFLMGG